MWVSPSFFYPLTNLTTWVGLEDFLSRGYPIVFKYNIKMKQNIYFVKHNYLMLY